MHDQFQRQVGDLGAEMACLLAAGVGQRNLDGRVAVDAACEVQSRMRMAGEYEELQARSLRRRGHLVVLPAHARSGREAT